MSKSGIKITSNFNLNKLPMSIPCPNDECDAKVSFTISDVKAGKTVECKECGVLVNLQEKK